MEPKLLPLSRLHSNLSCSICSGYLIDATTITECMHTFCKSCLLQRIENGRTSCPQCGIQLQRSRLAGQLRLDHAIQALVYAAVPGLWHEEQRRRKHFVDHHPLSTSVAPPLQHPTCFSPADPISLSLDFIPQSRDEDTNLHLKGPNSPQALGRRFFRCPAAVAVHHFQKLLSLKFELPPHYTVEIFCEDEKLPSTFRLMDVAYKTNWTQEEPLRLGYKIVKNQPIKMTALIATTGSGTNNVSHSQQRSKNSSTEVGANGAGTLKRPSAPPPSVAPAKQQKLSFSSRRNEESDDVFDQPSKPTRKKRGKKKRKRRKTIDLVPIVEPENPLKVKIVERIKSPEYTWSRSNGVELLVQAAELASRQNPTPPPPPEPTKDSPPPPPPETGDSVNNNCKPITSPPPPPEEPIVADTDDGEDDGKLMIADEVTDANLSSSNSNGRDSGMANDDDDDDSAGALDLSSKSSRSSPPEEQPPKQSPPPPEPRKSVSPQLIQQRSTALHSITDSLAQRQRQRLIQQQQEHRRVVVPPVIQRPGARNLVTSLPQVPPPNPERAATQRLIVAMHQFAAAAAAAVAARPPKAPQQPSKPLSYGLLRRPF